MRELLKKIEFVPGTGKVVLVAVPAMIAVPVTTIATGWNEDPVGEWVGPALVVVIYGVCLKWASNIKKKWKAEKAAASKQD